MEIEDIKTVEELRAHHESVLRDVDLRYPLHKRIIDLVKSRRILLEELQISRATSKSLQRELSDAGHVIGQLNIEIQKLKNILNGNK